MCSEPTADMVLKPETRDHSSSSYGSQSVFVKIKFLRLVLCAKVMVHCIKQEFNYSPICLFCVCHKPRRTHMERSEENLQEPLLSPHPVGSWD